MLEESKPALLTSNDGWQAKQSARYSDPADSLHARERGRQGAGGHLGSQPLMHSVRCGAAGHLATATRKGTGLLGGKWRSDGFLSFVCESVYVCVFVLESPKGDSPGLSAWVSALNT